MDRSASQPIERTLLAHWNLVASQVVASLAPLRLSVATPNERPAIYQLRYREVIARRWVNEAELPDGQESDAADDDAHHLAIWAADELVATARLVPPRPQQPLPTEAAAGLTFAPAGRVVEVGRAIVEPGYRDRQGDLFFGLLCAAWLLVQTTGHQAVGGCATAGMLRIYARLGFVLRPVGPGFAATGRQRYPVLLDLPTSLPLLINRAEEQLSRAHPAAA